MSDDDLSVDELYKKALAEFQALAEERNARATAPRLRPGDTLRDLAAQAGIRALRRIPNARWYAFDSDDARLQLGALVMACQNTGHNLTDLLEKLCKILPKWTQDRPPEDAGQIPEMMTDPITGQLIQNPWVLAPGAKVHDHKSQEVIRTKSPRLARWLEQAAKNNGVTAAMIDELEAERMEAETIRAIKYGAEEWQANALRPGAGSTVTQQGEFVRSIDSPYVLGFHRREADLGVPDLRYENLTTRMEIWHKASPEACEVHKAAREIYGQWKAEARQEAA